MVNILFIPTEFSTWHAARSWSYGGVFAFEEGFAAAGVEFWTIPAFRGEAADSPCSWLRHARRLVGGETFDQVWIELVHNDPGREFLEWLREVAPVRVGIVLESLEYDERALTLHPALRGRRQVVEERLRYVTHVLCADEADAQRLAREGWVKALWLPQSVPRRYFGDPLSPAEDERPLFVGTPYGERQDFLSHPHLFPLIRHLESSERQTSLPSLFDALQGETMRRLAEGFIPGPGDLSAYLGLLRRIRRSCFLHWMETLRKGGWVLNLPSMMGGYPGRVVEAMAAGRPVISWRAPGRPRTAALFCDGREIILVDDPTPEGFARTIGRVSGEGEYRLSMGIAAFRAVALHHTTERRIQEILTWIATGVEPQQGDDTGGDRFDVEMERYRQAFSVDLQGAGYAHGEGGGAPLPSPERIAALASKNATDLLLRELTPHAALPEFKGMIAHLLLAKGELEKAGGLLYPALAHDPENPLLVLDAAELALRRGDREVGGYFLARAARIPLSEKDRTRMAALSPLREGGGGDDVPPYGAESACGATMSVSHPTLSLCMIVKNEETTLPRCLESVRGVVDEIVVVDTGSTDRTVDVATRYGARVETIPWEDDFGTARNHSLDLARGEWVLVLDADEVISPRDHRIVRELVTHPGELAWQVVTRTYVDDPAILGWTPCRGEYPDEEVGEGWYPSLKIRLFRRDPRIRFEGKVHELVERTVKEAGIGVRIAPFVVHHYGRRAGGGKGVTYYRLGREKLAAAPDDTALIAELATQAAELGELEDARELWTRLLTLRPDDPEALFNRGGVNLILRRHEDALRDSLAAVSRVPLLKEGWINVATASLMRGDFGGARTALERVEAIEPSYPPLWIGMLICAVVEGDDSRAALYARRLAERGYDPVAIVAGRALDLQAASLGEAARRLQQWAQRQTQGEGR